MDEVLALVGLTPVARKRARGFSLGMGQRLGIASALLGDPEIVMFDEPVNGLDPEGILWIRNLMKRLAGEGRTVFVSSHLMSEMAVTADRRNSRSAVRLRSPEPERLLDVLAGAGLRHEPGPDGSWEVVDGDLARLGELAAANGVVLHELSPQQASLEEAFMQMTADSVEYHAGDGPGRDAAGAPGTWGAGWKADGARQTAAARQEEN